MSRSMLWALLVSALISLVLSLFSPTAEAHIGSGIVADSTGRVFFLDSLRNRVWRIDADGRLTLLAEHKHGDTLVLGADGNIYCEDVITGGVWKITPEGVASEILTKDQRRAIVGWTYFLNVAPDGSFLFVTGYPEQVRVLKISPAGESSILAGSTPGFADGPALAAQFREIHAAAWGADHSLFILDAHSVRKLTPDGRVSTVAGGPTEGFADGVGPAARFRHPTGLYVDPLGNILVADYGNRRLRKISPAGEVATVTQPTRLFTPIGVAAGGGRLYLLERFGTYNGISTFFSWVGDLLGDPRVRKISADGAASSFASVRGLTPFGWILLGLELAVLIGFLALIWLLRWFLRRRRPHRPCLENVAL
jgi:DNA-binding beta-propeller fold protein YncE